MRRLVMSVHGIRTHANWQKTLADVLSEYGFQSASFQYGKFSFFRFLLPQQRDLIVEAFREWYTQRTSALRHGRRPSVIAHSMGAYIVAHAVEKYPAIVFDKIILCGSILPREFPWQDMLERNQFWMLRNDYGSLDTWVEFVRFAVPDSGNSGSKGFTFKSPVLEQVCFPKFGHGDYYKEINIRANWIPFLKERSLEFDILYGRDVPSAEQYRDILRKTGDLDQRSYVGGGAAQEDELISDALCEEWLSVNPSIYVFLTDVRSGGQRILGYVNAMPVRAATFQRILNGDIEDNQITGADLLTFEGAEAIELYFMSIVIEPGARYIGDGLFQRAFERLLYAVTNQLVQFRRTFGCRVTAVAAVAWTREGELLCRWLGMEQVGVDKRGRSIYRISIDEEHLLRVNVFPGFRHLLA